MVGEFPELQGVIGGYLAEAQGEPKAVADAIRDHYKPVGQGDEVPTAPVTVAAWRTSWIAWWLLLIGERPTGSKDPFALRRAAISVIQLIAANGVRAGLLGIPLMAAAPVLAEYVRRVSTVVLLKEAHRKLLEQFEKLSMGPPLNHR